MYSVSRGLSRYAPRIMEKRRAKKAADGNKIFAYELPWLKKEKKLSLEFATNDCFSKFQ